MSCVRASKFAEADKKTLDEVDKDLSDPNIDAGKKLGAAKRALRVMKQHETEKLASLQDAELSRQKKKESFRDSVTSKEIKASKSQLQHLEAKEQALDQLTTTHDEIKKEERLLKQIDGLQSQLDGVPPERRQKAGVDTEAVTALKQKIADMKQQVKGTEWKQDQLRDASIKNYMARMSRRTAELERQLAEGDFTKKTITREKIMTPEMEAADREVKRLQREVQKAITEIEYRDRTPTQKALDFLTSFKRFSILSSPKSLFKLTAASSEVALARGFTEGTGMILKRFVPVIDRLSKYAPIEGGGNTRVAEDVQAYWRGLTAGMKEFKKIVRGDGSYLDVKFGKGMDVPQNWLGFFGRLHEAVKNPTRLANYEAGFNRYMKWAETQPDINPRDPSIINQAELAAFEFANRSIFKEDNYIIQQYNRLIAESKRRGAGGKAVAFALEQTLPIVKIPTNIIKQTFEYAFGSVYGTAKLVNAVSKGLETLPQRDAEVIMRQLKNGSAGLTFLAIGALFEEQIGGIYIKGEEEGETEYGKIAFIPHSLLENPLFAALQIGATMMRFWKTHIDESDYPSEMAGELARGFALTSLGLIEKAPFVSSMVNLEKLIHGGERFPITLTEIYARPYIPSTMQYVADVMDLEEPFNMEDWGHNVSSVVAPHAVKRAPENIWEAMELSIPFARENISPR